tara:strand:- start:802 stop:1242 length:441 start_codon:yes stop_codon:yes gene_type:complete
MLIFCKMSNQMTTPISSIPITGNVKPNDDIQDPIVQEILGNMAATTSNDNIPDTKVFNTQPIQHQHQQQHYNYPVQRENESFFSTFYDKKIMILTFIMIVVFIVINSNHIDDIINNIQISYVQEYKLYIKYILLYLILYIIQKYDF